MRDWRVALEAGINKDWGGNKPTGYSATARLVALVARIFDDAGFVVVPSEQSDGDVTS